MRYALNSLAIVASGWLLAHAQEDWVHRYGHRMEEARLPRNHAERQALAETIGKDGAALLEDIFDPTAPPLLREIPALDLLRHIWVQNYTVEDGQVRWRENEDIPPSARFISSPYDPEAHYSKKRSTTWIGYKVHLTETCEQQQPHLIMHVATTSATTGDEAMVDEMYEELQQEHLLPSQHFLDAGSVNAQTLTSSQHDYGVEMVGPARADCQWQASQAEAL